MLQTKRPLMPLMVALTLGFLPACISAHGDESRDADLPSDLDEAAPIEPELVEAALPPPTMPAAIHSVGEWDALPKEARQVLVEDDCSRYPNMALSPKQRLRDLKTPEAKAFGEKLADYMRANGDMSVQDSSHSQAGELEHWVQLLTLDGKTILAGIIIFDQQGCDMPDDSIKVFKTTGQADAAGCEMQVGSWSAQGSFNRDATPFQHGDYMEWTPTSGG